MWEETITILIKKPYHTEDDVREEFITPLLKILGYGPEEIKRGTPLKTKSMDGSKSVAYKIPDYIIEIEGKPEFVIEAKSPTRKNFTPTDIKQAHSYAVDREVNVKYFIISNAYITAVYDTEDTNFDPIPLKRQIEDFEWDAKGTTLIKIKELKDIFGYLLQFSKSAIITKRLIKELQDIHQELTKGCGFIHKLQEIYINIDDLVKKNISLNEWDCTISGTQKDLTQIIQGLAEHKERHENCIQRLHEIYDSLGRIEIFNKYL